MEILRMCFSRASVGGGDMLNFFNIRKTQCKYRKNVMYF
jgi:hypothetical protein